ncbi:3-methyladenine DNA glycosylase [Campylobacter helveticus]|uniref:Endonuclease III domain-containing protein n=1 Tax=Campylobacter helveticus TaxID=28898 RepID=A0AAX2UG48_9BACT|nr:3-methyladenine DNA glycosylase [Campylobacter helveticus]MCR2066032.1 3-methyladenine DNA glycosylase [Campylobacter helveticus]TNB55152.1 endonuclease III domain-containing protein [Campylobacter helveticus]TNB61988.1 endonuclease III domain-containing protein [Campylobacter helveticus]
MNSAEIFKKLLSFDLKWQDFDWLCDRGLSEFEILISVILTQNTNWNNVLKALQNCKKAQISSLNQVANLENEVLAALIKPSGFYNTKAKRLKGLVDAILKDFENLENFKKNVSREWLLSIKGLGYESVDGILNYLCKREILVVDNYTYRLALNLGYELEDYEDLREFFQNGIEQEEQNLCQILGRKCELYELYQIYHALIVAFGKLAFKGKRLNEQGENWIKQLKIL